MQNGLGLGRLCSLYGRKRVFIAGTVQFTLALLLCGIATGPEVLVAARAQQGPSRRGASGVSEPIEDSTSRGHVLTWEPFGAVGAAGR